MRRKAAGSSRQDQDIGTLATEGKLSSRCGGPVKPNVAELPRGLVQLHGVGGGCEDLGKAELRKGLMHQFVGIQMRSKIACNGV